MRNKKGFTLIEIIIVLIIIAILAAIAVPAMMKYINDAKEKQHIATARAIYLASQYVTTLHMAETDTDPFVSDVLPLTGIYGGSGSTTTFAEAIAEYLDTGTTTVLNNGGTVISGSASAGVTQIVVVISGNTYTFVPGA